MLKHFLVLLALSVMLLGNAFGVDDKPPPHKLSSHMKEEPYRGYTGLLTSIDFLYWKAWEDNLEYVVQTNQTVIGADFERVHQLREPDTEFDPGFRLRLVYNLPKRRWDISLAWVRFHTDGSDTIRAPNPGGASPFTRATNILWDTNPSQIETATEDWKLRYNTLDLILSRTFFINHHFSLCPGVGLRGAWIHQDVNVSASDIPPSPVLGIFRMNAKNDFDAIGVWTGFCADWMVWNGIGIFGEGVASLLYGRFKTEQEFFFQLGANFNTDVLNVKVYRFRPNLEAAIGLRYKYAWQDVALTLQFAYETLAWFNQMMLRSISNAFQPFFKVSGLGDLGMHGWRFRASLDY